MDAALAMQGRSIAHLGGSKGRSARLMCAAGPSVHRRPAFHPHPAFAASGDAATTIGSLYRPLCDVGRLGAKRRAPLPPARVAADALSFPADDADAASSKQQWALWLALGPGVAAATAAAAVALCSGGGAPAAAASLAAAGRALLLDSPLARSGAVPAFSLVFLSEIGDKTFFITALSAMRLGRAAAFAGAMAGLTAVTLGSVALGAAFAALPDALRSAVPTAHIAGAAPALLAFFGLRSLREALAAPASGSSSSGSSGGSSDGGASVASSSSEGSSAEEEAAAALAAAGGVGGGGGGGASCAAAASAQARPWGAGLALPRGRLRGTLELAALVMLAELGDRSMMAVVALGATPSLAPAAVAAGAVAAHAVAAALAVLGGAVAARHVSERAVNAASGALMLLFAAAAFLEGAA